MRIIVNFTGLFRLHSGMDQDIVEVPNEGTIDTLIDLLAEKHNELPFKDAKTLYTRNEKVSSRNAVLKNGDQIFVFQTLSGG